MTKEFWDNRYKNHAFAYGEEANEYLQEKLINQKPGTILFPAEGEGRNALFAAKLGWRVSAFDISIEGKNKAEKRAANNMLNIDYQVGELENLHFKTDEFDAMALIYAHFPAAIKSIYHRKLDTFLRIDGLLIFEAFSKKHLEYNSKNDKIGGPKDLNMLFSIEEIKSDFHNYETIELMEKEVELREGDFHNGLGSVIRFVGRKKYRV